MDEIYKANMLGWSGGLRGGKHEKYEVRPDTFSSAGLAKFLPIASTTPAYFQSGLANLH